METRALNSHGAARARGDPQLNHSVQDETTAKEAAALQQEIGKLQKDLLAERNRRQKAEKDFEVTSLSVQLIFRTDMHNLFRMLEASQATNLQIVRRLKGKVDRTVVRTKSPSEEAR